MGFRGMWNMKLFAEEANSTRQARRAKKYETLEVWEPPLLTLDCLFLALCPVFGVFVCVRGAVLSKVTQLIVLERSMI